MRQKQEVLEFGATTRELLKLAGWLGSGGCEMVAMESTVSYWKPLYNILESSGLNAMVVNARHMKAVPGRKTDVKDAEWIADLLQASYIPDKDQWELRERNTSAKAVISVIGTDMGRFPDDAHIASWVGLCPGDNESAGKRKSGKTRKGNALLRETLINCAHAAVRNKKSYFYAQFMRISALRGKKRAYVAVAHSMLVAIYHILKDGVVFKDPGADNYNQFNKERKFRAYLKKLKALGWEDSAAGQPA